MKYKNSLFNIYLKAEDYIEKDKPGYISVFNTMSLQFAEIPQNCDYNNPPQYLIDNSIVVPFELDEAQAYKKTQTDKITNDFPTKTTITICTTFVCNYRCAYCFHDGCQGIDINEETISSMIDYIKNEIDRNTKLKHLNILWFGGEPLLRFFVIQNISDIIIPYCESKGIKYTANIITNGYFMTRDISERLKNLKVTCAQIALDGKEDIYNSLRLAPKDAYNKVLKNIEESAIPVHIRLNVTKDTQNEIFELVEDLCKSDIYRNKKNYIYLHRVIEYSNEIRYGFTDEEWLLFRTKIENYLNFLDENEYFNIGRTFLTCPIMQKRNVTLGADGNIYRCHNHVINPKYSIGRITDGINPNNETEKRFSISTIDDNCSHCNILPFCGGGSCRHEELLKGKPCKYIKELFRQKLTYQIRKKMTKKAIHHGSLLPRNN